jgi:hypothetical protein
LNDEVLTNQYTNTCNPVSSLSTPADDYTQNVTLKVIPNPATNKIKIIFSEPIKSIKLYSITGSFINKQLINGYIDVSDLPIGVYFLSVNQYPIKFLKQ